MKVAVIGSGISGLSAAYFLSKKYKVDLFEKEDRFGGHSHTIDIKLNEDTNKIHADIGFIVFNKKTYPNLINFFKEIDVDIEKSNMSLSFMSKDIDLEYCGKGLKGIFSHKKNLFNFDFFKMFLEILKFYKKSSKLNEFNEDMSLGEYLVNEKHSEYFTNYHLIPMVSAIWSMPPYDAKKMPIKFFMKFFQNHGLFNLSKRPQWYTVKNRSRQYVNKVIEKISGKHFKNYKIDKIKRISNFVRIFYGSENEYFDYDKVIIATHADEAKQMIEDKSEEETKILGSFQYKKNLAIIHSDEVVMPQKRFNWSAWNTSISKKNSSVTYWLNLLQNFKINKNIFLTLNPFEQINTDKIIKKVEFTHPYYDHKTLKNQKNLHLIQNKKNILFCGSYFGYGFHEDGIKSTLEMIKFLND
ncbi:NAD(P)/FAD-dependent oxidoreductase [Candidatus Pelagibacter communis]|uniref:NAD(P)/FAD-dependent oxidoreductase n=1 Tax=Pelagibacter ubique TaxID=198252 RepID=UPI00094CFB1A|nr:FAD-dependent oxidoreductase [Candidatus Pelagibacter ubique]